MTEITRLNQLISAVQNAATSRARRGTDPARTPQSRSRSLEQRLAADIASLDTTTDEGRRLARRRFVQTVLVDQLGEGFAASPAFAAVSQEVETAFGDDASLRHDLDTLLSGWRRAGDEIVQA